MLKSANKYTCDHLSVCVRNTVNNYHTFPWSHLFGTRSRFHGHCRATKLASSDLVTCSGVYRKFNKH